jgi:hypothetical protein
VTSLARRPRWRCPKCGHRFVTANLWHSCGRYELARHFSGRDPVVRKMFDRLVKLVRGHGPATIYAQKSRIVGMVDVRFVGITTSKRALKLHLWLKRRAQHPSLVRHESFGRLGYGNHFKFESVEAMDAEFDALVGEAYRIGCREARG